MPVDEDQYRQYLELAKEPMEMGEYIEQAWKTILPNDRRGEEQEDIEEAEGGFGSTEDGRRYNKEMIKKTVANLIRCGFLKKSRGFICRKHTKEGRTKPVKDCPECRPAQERVCERHKDMGYDDPDPECPQCSGGFVTIGLYPIGKGWVLNAPDASFQKLVLESMKTGWGYQHRLPMALEAAKDILAVFSTEESVSITARGVHDRLTEKYDINVAKGGGDRSVREIMKLLVAAGALNKDGQKYSRGDERSFKRVKEGLNKADLVYQVEKIIDNYGPRSLLLGKNEDDRQLKALMSKYYLYIQSGGVGKERWFLNRIHKMLFETRPKNAPIELSTGWKAKIEKHDLDKERAALRNACSSRWGIHYEDLLNFNIGALRQIRDAPSREDVISLMDSYSSRFNRAGLDKLCHSDGSYRFSIAFEPYKWQTDATAQWIEGTGSTTHEPYHGIVSVVTGAGKTVMAMNAIQEYNRTFPDSKISIIVPTRVLMYQWARELSKLLAIPSKDIGFRGDGLKDSFEDRKVMVLIVNSAIQDNFLEGMISRLDPQVKHFLIADECHRYTGEKFRGIFTCRRDATLGLSATPVEAIGESEGEEEDSDIPEAQMLIQELGPIFFNLNYKQALNQDLISPFTVNYVGIDLTAKERVCYNDLSKKLSKVLEKIRLRYGNRLDLMPGRSLDQKLQTILNKDKDPDQAIAQYFTLVRDRRDVVNNAVNRKGAFLYLLKEQIEDEVVKRKTIVFHERIEQLEEIVAPLERREYLRNERGEVDKIEMDEAERQVNSELESLLLKPIYRPVMYHSGHEKDFWNTWALDWYADGTANVMLSVKALIEGVDVPAADVGIVRVSSGSVRQRIQSTGRILRKSKGKKESNMYVIFARNTVDENIFRKINWEEEIGASDIRLFYWLPEDNEDPLKPQDNDLLPRPINFEDNLPPINIDLSSLNVGDKFPGRFVGEELHVTADGRPFKRSMSGRLFIKNKVLLEAGMAVRAIKGGGKLLVTPQGAIVTKTKGEGAIFLGVIDPNEMLEEIAKTKQDLKKLLMSKKPKSGTPTFEELFGK